MEFHIQSVPTEKVLERLDNRVVLNDIKAQDNQLWMFQDNFIRNKHDGSVLEVCATTGDIVARELSRGTNQKWSFDADSTLRNWGTNKVLQISDTGDKVSAVKKTGSETQRFKVEIQ